MAQIAPFKGILYNPEKIEDISDVVAPPYDVISPREQEAFHRQSPYNVIRLILGRTHDSDTSTDNRYTRAAAYLKKWRQEGILVRDRGPAFYLSSVQFPIEGETVTRFGLVALVRLEPFEKGIVLPHEKTFSKVKSERLEIMKACNTNFSPIFSLYSDQEGILGSLKEAVDHKKPDMDFFDSNGFTQRLWRITDPDVHEQIIEAMADKTIFIADGHHRYETALNYRDWVRERTPDFSPDHPANFVMMSLSSIEDPGLVILPAHRILSEVAGEALERFREVAHRYFEMRSFPFTPTSMAKVSEQFIDQLNAASGTTRIGVYIKDRPSFDLITLKPGIMETLFSAELPESLLDLDVTVLTRLVFMEILGFDQARLDNEKLISYSSKWKDAIDHVHAGEHDVTFLLNPTKMEQVQTVAQAGLIMPRKSTYFFPKVISGHVLNPLEE